MLVSAEEQAHRDTRRLIARLAIFSIPFVLLMSVIVVVDPYNVVSAAGFIPREVKMRTAYPLHQPLWKLGNFQRNPKSHIILGDSRMDYFREKSVVDALNQPVANLAYGGGSLAEAVDSFWIAAAITPLRSATFGVNFESFNDYANIRRTEDYSSIAANPLLYFCNRTVLKATAYTLQSAITGTDPKIGVPNVSREAFWREILDGPATRRMLSNYIRPKRYSQELARIASYCAEKNIRLRFVIMPTHEDFRSRIEQARLGEEFRNMRYSLSSLAETLDFDYRNELTSDAENFRDPVHLKSEWAPVLAREIWLGERRYAAVWPISKSPQARGETAIAR